MEKTVKKKYPFRHQWNTIWEEGIYRVLPWLLELGDAKVKNWSKYSIKRMPDKMEEFVVDLEISIHWMNWKCCFAISDWWWEAALANNRNINNSNKSNSKNFNVMSTKGQLNYNKLVQKTKFFCTVRAAILVQLMYINCMKRIQSHCYWPCIISSLLSLVFAVIFLEAKNKS